MKTPKQWLETVDFDWDEQVSVRMIEAIQQDAFESGVQKYRPAWAKAMDHIIDSPCHCKPEEQYEPCHRCQTLKIISDLLATPPATKSDVEVQK